MTDREKVINCLKDIEQIMVCRQEICPREELQYWIELQEGVADALALLKEQEAVVRCKDCKWKYEDDGRSLCGYHSGWFPAEPDWFCADGVMRE